MYYTIYKVTNVLNGKFYIGKHQTNNLEDGYFGSGKLIRKAIAKYGSAHFRKDILFIFDTELEMNQKETEIVSVEFLTEHRDQCYNLCPGGRGGFGYINSNSELIKKRDRYDNKRKGYDASLKGFWVGKIQDRKRINTPAIKEKIRSSKIQNGTLGEVGHLTSKESIDKRKNTFRQRCHSQGANNSQFGTRWITDGVKNKKIKVSEFPPTGWKFGRTKSTIVSATH